MVKGNLAYDVKQQVQDAIIMYDKSNLFLGQLRLVPKIGQGVN
jgi:hypothetical protein